MRLDFKQGNTGQYHPIALGIAGETPETQHGEGNKGNKGNKPSKPSRQKRFRAGLNNFGGLPPETREPSRDPAARLLLGLRQRGGRPWGLAGIHLALSPPEESHREIVGTAGNSTTPSRVSVQANSKKRRVSPRLTKDSSHRRAAARLRKLSSDRAACLSGWRCGLVASVCRTHARCGNCP